MFFVLFLLSLNFFAGASNSEIGVGRESLQFITAVNRTQPLTLAVSPKCSNLDNETFGEVNTGVQLNATK